MGLLLAHPRIVQQTCDLCRQWVFDSQYRRLMRHGQPVARPAGAPTPCITCVKKNPTDGERFDHSVPYFMRLVRRYHEVVGTGGAVSLRPSGPSRFCIATWAWCMPRCGKPMRPKRPDNSISCVRKEPRDDSDSAISLDLGHCRIARPASGGARLRPSVGRSAGEPAPQSRSAARRLAGELFGRHARARLSPAVTERRRPNSGNTRGGFVPRLSCVVIQWRLITERISRRFIAS